MKKIFRIILLITLLASISVTSVSAATKTIATVEFTAFEMSYFDTGNQHWYIGEGAVSNIGLEEYGCVHNQYGMTATNKYAAIKRYQLQTDSDFSFEGSASLVFNKDVQVDENKAQIEFFVCTNKGQVIYPNDGNKTESITKSDGVVTVSGEAKGLKAGDFIYFVALNESPVQHQYLQFGATVWETEYNQPKAGPFSNTNAYKGIQGEDGWSFMCAKSSDIKFNTAEIEVKSVVENTDSTVHTSRYPKDSGIVVSTAEQLFQPVSEEEMNESLFKMKSVVTLIVITGAVVLIGQNIVFALIRKKKSINSIKEVK